MENSLPTISPACHTRHVQSILTKPPLPPTDPLLLADMRRPGVLTKPPLHPTDPLLLAEAG